MKVLWYILLEVLLKIITVRGYQGICTRTMVYTTIKTSYTHISRLQISKGFWPWSRKKNVVYDTIPIQKTVYDTRTEYVCCENYSGIYPDCEPMCLNGCDSGECIAPNVCKCQDGYEFNLFGSVCDPICPDGCENGICSAPDNCTCLDGYRLDSINHCTPVCENGCPFGRCIAPNKCECQDGYTMNASGSGCEPKCTQNCDHGFCHRPEMCVCHQGYQMGPGNKCEPVCSQGCLNGICIEPEICSCLPGYRMPGDSVTRCEPICEPECQNSDCFEPDICLCWMDYIPINKTSCEPYCPEKCFNGYCAEPHNCTCNEGYEPHDYEPNVCIPICDNCSFGDCISPGNCLCWPGFYMNENDSKCHLDSQTTEGSSTSILDTSSISEFSSTQETVLASSIESTTENFPSTVFADSTSYFADDLDEVSEDTTEISDSGKLLSRCNCWLLSSHNNSHSEECTPNCNATTEAFCMDEATCEILDENRQELSCNGIIYVCRSLVNNVSTSRNWLLWIFLAVLLFGVSIFGLLLFVGRQYRYRGSVMILDTKDPRFAVQYVK